VGPFGKFFGLPLASQVAVQQWVALSPPRAIYLSLGKFRTQCLTDPGRLWFNSASCGNVVGVVSVVHTLAKGMRGKEPGVPFGGIR
jgi:hypothetical protein